MITQSRLQRAGSGLVVPILATLAVLAWIALLVWGRSPEARFLSHAHAAAAPGPAVALLFVAGWLVMVIAMMLPTTFSLVAMFARMVRERTDGKSLVALLVVGYLSVWTAFGAMAYVADAIVHEVVHHIAWLQAHPWAIASATLVGAGAFQFSKLKYRCLDKCRSPFAFISSHWSGNNERLEAVRLGTSHGLFCVGCCWALMLVMFAVGTGQLAVMFGLGLVMVAEKNHPWGRRLARPTGVTFLLLGALVALINVT